MINSKLAFTCIFLCFYFTVIKDTLENKGSLGQIKARIRAEVFNALNEEGDSKPQLSNENLIINELIREYLDFNKYKYASSVLVAGIKQRFSLGRKQTT